MGYSKCKSQHIVQKSFTRFTLDFTGKTQLPPVINIPEKAKQTNSRISLFERFFSLAIHTFWLLLEEMVSSQTKTPL
jgi:hypothetical protein